jgi:phospholipid transport system substrate-binding protein
MKTINRFFTTLLSILVLLYAGNALAQEAPDVLVKRISQDVLNTAKSDKAIQSGNQKRIRTLVESKILPHVDFYRMTSLAVGQYWRQATQSQQQRLTKEFRDLLIHTYAGAIAQIQDQKLQFRPFRASPSDTDVVVYSQVIQSKGREPIQLNYRLEKHSDGWKIYDINVLGAWLVQTYKGTFATEIGRSGIDGLIRTLAEKNKKLAASPLKGVKS